MAVKRSRDIEVLRFENQLGATLRRVRSAEKAFRYAVRSTRAFFDADRACLAFLAPGARQAEVTFSIPAGAGWDHGMLTRFLLRERPHLPHDLILAPIRKSRPGAALIALGRDGEEFVRGDGRHLASIATVISACLQEIDRERAREIRARIDRKIMEELRPKDFLYQILHGIRSLTHYDHSSSLLIGVAGGEVLELVAEQIAWRKGKSERIGLRLPLTDEHRKSLRAETIHGFNRVDGGWRSWIGGEDTALAELCDYDAAHDRERPERSLLCAPLVTRDGFLGLLKVASQHAGAFGEHQAELVRSFLPQAAVAIQNSRRAESLRERILEVEKRTAVAALARGVSHDINNALGSVLPLVQQMRADLADGVVDPVVLGRDLEQIERSLQLCRRIFAGMLDFARGSTRRIGSRRVDRAIEGTLAILEDGFKRRGIRVTTRYDRTLPAVRGREGDLEQLLLNLASNARDAMPNGGRLTIEARADDGVVEILIVDTGDGISPEVMKRIYEPFFSTKDRGSGLGLSICSSIISDMQGEMQIDCPPGGGTRVRVVLPASTA